MKLPLDFQEANCFRRLRTLLQPDRTNLAAAERDAMWVWMRLWRELAYKARDGATPGKLETSDVPLLVQALGEGFNETIMEVMVTADVISRTDGGYLCAVFARCNAELSPQHRSREQQGGDMRAYWNRQSKIQEDAAGEMMLFPAEKLVDTDGTALTPDMIRRLHWLVGTLDSALFKKQRQPHQITSYLVETALTVLKQFTNEEIAVVCKAMAMNRSHPALAGMTTEKMLPEFGGILKMLQK